MKYSTPMPTDIFTKIACVFTIFIFLGNDVMASVSAFQQMDAINYQLIKNPSDKPVEKIKNLRPDNSSRPAVETHHEIEGAVEAPDIFVNRAEAKTAYIGAHHKDPLKSPADNIFTIDLKDEVGNFKYAYLHYQTKGIANPDALPKSINQQEVYVGAELIASEKWQRSIVMLDYEDLHNGLNQIRFALPNKSKLGVEVKSVELQLANEIKSYNKGLKLKRQKADVKDFKVVERQAEFLSFSNRDIEMASVPKSIRNVTRNAWGYGLRNASDERLTIAIGVDVKKLNKATDINEANIFYFDKVEHSWKRAHIDKIDVSKAVLEANVPPNTDYFAGMIKSPDMPEASAFVPTGISDIEAANPASGMNLMSPPSQSRTGEASISYPLSIPAGRQGLNPQVGLNYSSDGGTGWLGVGWSVSSPSVSIDTRWGVPKFPAGEQEEVYSLNGSSLIQEGGTKGNRADVTSGAPQLSPRLTGTVHFFTSTMSGYKKIERVGTEPSDYVWIETMANGTKYYYGTEDGSEVDTESVLADANGNIVKWCLKKVEDQWGNNIIYTYAKKQHTIGANPSLNPLKNNGWTLILSKINYTGFNQDPGKYEVVFESSENRIDATVSMKNGFKVLDEHRLDKIVVNYDGDEVKHYRLYYGSGDFEKTRLDSVTEFRSQKRFYSHDFEYYSGTLTYGSAQTFPIDNFATDLVGEISDDLDFLKKPILNVLSASPIKTTSTFGWSTGGSVGLGIAPIGQYFNGKKFTFSGQLGYSESYNRDKRSLQDMNGDGLLDLVVDKKQGRGFYPIERTSNGLELGIFTSIQNGDQPLFKTKSSTWNYGFDFSLDDNIFFYGKNWSSGKSTVESYTTDYNADGFPDLVFEDSDGKSRLLFGKLNSYNELVYVNSSETTANPVLKDQSLEVVNTDDEDLKDLETVKIWTAPINGTISITGIAESLGNLTGETRVAVQKGNSFLVHNFRAVDNSTSVTTNYGNVSVVKGDVIMFRAKSATDGQQDLITWNPQIEYTSSQFFDGNNINYTRSDYEEAFIPSGSEYITIQGDEKIKVTLNRSLPSALTDDLVYKMTVIEKDANLNIVSTKEYTNVLNAGTVNLNNTSFSDGSNSINLGASSFQLLPGATSENNYSIFFSLFSTSNVDWKRVKFRPTVEIALYDDCDLGATMYPIVEYGTYNRVHYLFEKFDTQEVEYDEELAYRVWPKFSYSSSNVQDIFENASGNNQSVAYMTVKDGTNIYSKLRLTFHQSNGTITYDKVDALGNSINGVTSTSNASAYSLSSPDFSNNLYVEFFVEDFVFSKKTAEFIVDHMEEITLQDNGAGSWSDIATSRENYNVFYQDPEYVGDKILHWGQFAWSYDNTIPENTPILTEDLKPDFEDVASNTENQFDDENTPDSGFWEQNADGFNPMNHKFITLKAVRGEKDYMLRTYETASYGELQTANLLSPEVADAVENLDRYSCMGTHIGIYASAGLSSPGKFGETEIVVTSAPNQVSNGLYTAFAAPLVNKTKSSSSTTGSPIGSVSSTVNNANKYFSYSLVQFQDFNGDSYPDRLVEDGSNVNVNFTSPLGGHGNAQQLTSYELSKSVSDNSASAKPGSYIDKDQRFEKMGSPSLNFGTNEEYIQHTDINGDGLPDRIEASGVNGITAALSHGSGFDGSAAVTNYSSGVAESSNSSFSLNFNLGKIDKQTQSTGASFRFGVGVNHVASSSNTVFMDLNGDGLSDCIALAGTTATVFINRGTSFYSHSTVNLDKKLNDANGFGFSGSIAGTYAFPAFSIPILGIDLKVSVNLNGGANFSQNEVQSSFMDVNGDGFADYITEDGGLKVQYAQVGKSNLLKKVNNPLGGSFTIEYDRLGNKTGYHDPIVNTHTNLNKKILWDMPQSKWVMSELKLHDGFDANNGTDLDGADEMINTFLYDGGIKSRRERDFHGFTRIESRQLPFENVISRNTSERQAFEFGAQETGEFYYISQVSQYMAPTQNEFNYRKRNEYTKGLLTEKYVYYNKLKKVEVPTGGFSETYELYPINVELYTYDFKNVCLDPNSSYFNEIYPSTDPEVEVDWSKISETQSIFPSVSTIQKINYPDVINVSNRDKYFSQKFFLEYDVRWNVTRYEDEGRMVGRVPSTTVVESFTRNWYDYKTVDRFFSSFPSKDLGLSDDTYDVYVISYSDPSYSDDVVYIAKAADPCFGFNGQNYPDDNTIITTVHKKPMTETVQITKPSYMDVYQDKLIAVMEYFNPSAANGQTGMLRTHKIYENNDIPANMKRRTEVSALHLSKAPSSISNYLQNGSSGETDIDYNTNGTVRSITGPANANNQRMTLTFTYDSQLSQFVTEVSNSFSESICNHYDYGTGNLIKSTDINGHAMRYVYDDMYRIIEVWAPRQLYDASASATISFEYYVKGINPASSDPNDKVPVAITNHNMDNSLATDPFNTPASACATLTDLSERTAISNPLQTATFIDGLSRVMQVKKGNVKEDGSHNNVLKYQVSGWITHDQWGQEEIFRNSLLEANTNHLGRLLVTTSDIMNSKYFDYQGRDKKAISIVGIDPNSTGYDYLHTEYDYDWMVQGSEEFMRVQVTRKENGLSAGVSGQDIQLTNSRGRQRYSIQVGGSSNQTTEFIYNPLGELLQSVDPIGESTAYTYDWFGRTTQEVHPDRGTTSWTYDFAGNVSTLNNEGTGSNNIAFDYDYNRMTSKTVPDNDDLYNVSYTYGASGDGKNGAGRVVTIVQGTNFKTENFKYDELGNKILEQKVMNVPQAGTRTWNTEYDYDSWGRVLEMLYPDNERVFYHYHNNGELERITSSNPNTQQSYITVDKITYDGFGNIDYMRYGNYTETHFEYDPITRNIQEVDVWTRPTAGGAVVNAFDRVFDYDASGRINSLDQSKVSASITAGVVDHDYAYVYDQYNRLTSTTGNIDGTTYSLTMTYDAAGAIATKNQSYTTNHTYNLSYNYNSSKPHQIQTVDGHTYAYNDAGSIESVSGTNNETFVWNEEEWLMAVSNGNGYHHYVYDQNGERIMKSTLTSGTTAFDGQGNTNTAVLDPYAVYVNPYYVVTSFAQDDNVSKHYFMGSQRVASEVVTYGEGAGNRESSTNPNNNEQTSATERSAAQSNVPGTNTNTTNEEGANQTGNNLQQAGEQNQSNPVLTNLSKVLTKLGLEEGDDFDMETLKQAHPIEDYFDMSAYGTPTPDPEQSAAESDGPESGEGQAATRLRFWYHNNYLGNVDMITNNSGIIHQYFVYTPFGEGVYEYSRNSTFDSWYRFNGKELDDETGNQYYGARYYDPKISVWLSVDPLAHKFPSLTPYHFVHNNPIHIVDPNGEEGIVVSGQPGHHKNKKHFLINGLEKAEAAMNHRQDKNEQVTWIIYNDGSEENGHDPKMLQEYRKLAEEKGINVKVVNDVDDIVDYVNNKNGKNDSRKNDLITSFYYVGHATPGDLDAGYPNENFEPDDFKSSAFASGCHVNLVGGCRTAIPGTWEDSAVTQFKEILDDKSRVYGTDVRVFYPGGKVSDEKLVEKNKGKIISKKGEKKSTN